MRTQIILVPGFWLGAWAWDAVAPLLTARGFEVSALTLPGLDGGDLDATVEDHADAIATAANPDADRRVLVVHSGAAVPGTLVLDRDPTLFHHVVYVDTAPVTTGFAINPATTGEAFTLAQAWDDLEAEGSLRDLTDEQLQIFRQRAVPQPIHTVATPVALTNDARNDVASTIICCEYSAADFRSYAEQGVPFLAGINEHRALRLVDLPTGHWPMWSRPEELADLIAEAADRH